LKSKTPENGRYAEPALGVLNSKGYELAGSVPVFT